MDSYGREKEDSAAIDAALSKCNFLALKAMANNASDHNRSEEVVSAEQQFAMRHGQATRWLGCCPVRRATFCGSGALPDKANKRVRRKGVRTEFVARLWP